MHITSIKWTTLDCCVRMFKNDPCMLYIWLWKQISLWDKKKSKSIHRLIGSVMTGVVNHPTHPCDKHLKTIQAVYNQNWIKVNQS